MKRYTIVYVPKNIRFSETILTVNTRIINNNWNYLLSKKEDIWDMIQKCYSYVGGYKGATDFEDLVRQTKIWKVVRRGNKVSAVAAYRDQHGLKSICAAMDGSFRGKRDILMLFQEDVRMQRSWAEVSHKVEKMKLRLGFLPVPNVYAEDLLNKPILNLSDDGYHYDRIIGGELRTKMIVGWVKGYEFLPKIL